MAILEDVVAAYTALTADEPDPALLPAHLAKSCLELGPVAGATINLYNNTAMPVPIGTSCPAAAAAESLEFTFSDGPSLRAWTTQQPVIAHREVLAEQWPLLYDAVVEHSSFRAVISLPLRHGLAGTGTLNLYLRGDSDVSRLDSHDILVVNDWISHTLINSITLTLTPGAHTHPNERAWSSELGPVWLGSRSAAPRSAVAVAVGILIEVLHVTQLDALALLRGHAFTTDRTVDQVATEITTWHLDPAELDPQGAF